MLQHLQGQAYLIAKMPIKENRKNGGQKSGQHVPQELHHRQSPPFGGLPHSSLIKIILSRQCGHERRALRTGKAAPEAAGSVEAVRTDRRRGAACERQGLLPGVYASERRGRQLPPEVCRSA